MSRGAASLAEGTRRRGVSSHTEPRRARSRRAAFVVDPRVPRPDPRSCWAWFLPVGSRLSPSGRAPGEASFTTRAPPPRSKPPHYGSPEHAAQSPQRQRTSSNLLAPALALAPALSREPPRSPRLRVSKEGRGEAATPTATARPPAGRAAG